MTKRTTMLLDFPPLRAGDVVEFARFLPGDCVEIVGEDGIARQVEAAYVSADFLPTHGGARPGAGRPRLADDHPTVEITISLPQSLAEKAGRIGDGNRSSGVRRSLEAYREIDTSDD